MHNDQTVAIQTTNEKPWHLYFVISIVPVFIATLSFVVGVRGHSQSELSKNETGSMKEHSLKTKNGFLIHTAKLALPLSFHIEQITENIDPLKPIEYKATISRESSQRIFNYKLILPNGVTLTSGLLLGRVDLTDADATIEFSVVQNDDTDKKISILLEDTTSKSTNMFTFSTTKFKEHQQAQEDLIIRRDKYHDELQAQAQQKNE